MKPYKQMAVIRIAINRNGFAIETLNNATHVRFDDRTIALFNQTLAT